MTDSFRIGGFGAFKVPPIKQERKKRERDKNRFLLSNVRLIARLDIKSENLVKGVHLEGLRIIGDPQKYATKYYQAGADEIIYMDIVASLYGRSNMVDIVRRTAQKVFIPLTVGGGIRSIEDANLLLRAGADKIAINTAATQNPELIKHLARRFGSQSIVLSIEAKRKCGETWEVYTDNGRNPTGLNVLDWAKQGVEYGAGEILLTSVDQEGTRKGYDIDLVREISNSLAVPVIASGGMGELEHLKDVIIEGRCDGAAVADVIHYDRFDLPVLRNYLLENDIPVRRHYL